MDARLAELFFPPEAEPEPEAKPDLGPAAGHRLHGSIPITDVCELRITSQPRRQCGDRVEPARLVCRKWYLRRDSETWWPSKQDPGVFVLPRQARAFLEGVAAACAALEHEGET